MRNIKDIQEEIERVTASLHATRSRMDSLASSPANEVFSDTLGLVLFAIMGAGAMLTITLLVPATRYSWWLMLPSALIGVWMGWGVGKRALRNTRINNLVESTRGVYHRLEDEEARLVGLKKNLEQELSSRRELLEEELDGVAGALSVTSAEELRGSLTRSDEDA